MSDLIKKVTDDDLYLMTRDVRTRKWIEMREAIEAKDKRIAELEAELEDMNALRAFEMRIVEKQDTEITTLRAWLDRLLFTCGGDHMSACDITMGSSHPCTCGATEIRREYRVYLENDV